MSERQLVAQGLASALLAGEWRADELVRRARYALGEKPLWLSALVQSVMASHPEPPRDVRDELAAFIEQHPLFERGFLRPRTLRIVRWLTDAPAMGEMRWPVPVLTTSVEVARLLEREPGELDWLADVRGLERFASDEALRNYRYRWYAKPSGGVRVLEAPKPRLKTAQRKLLAAILNRIPAHPGRLRLSPRGLDPDVRAGACRS